MIEETYQAEGVISMTNTSLENRLFYDLEHSMRDGIVKDRVFYLLKWYQKKAEWYKVLTYIATALSILFPAVLTLLNIPALSNCFPEGFAECLRGTLPVVNSIGAGFYAFLQSRSNWIRYRTAAEQIKRETVQYLALHGAGTVRDIGAEEKFLNKIEEICALEFSEWQHIRAEVGKKERD